MYKNPSFWSCKANYKPNRVRRAPMAVWTPHVCKLFDSENPQLGVSKRAVYMEFFFSCRPGMTWGHIKTVISVSFHPLLSCLQYRGFPWTKPFFFFCSLCFWLLCLNEPICWRTLPGRTSSLMRTEQTCSMFCCCCCLLFFFLCQEVKLLRKEQEFIPAFQRLPLHQNSCDTPQSLGQEGSPSIYLHSRLLSAESVWKQGIMIQIKERKTKQNKTKIDCICSRSSSCVYRQFILILIWFLWLEILLGSQWDDLLPGTCLAGAMVKEIFLQHEDTCAGGEGGGTQGKDFIISYRCVVISLTHTCIMLSHLSSCD